MSINRKDVIYITQWNITQSQKRMKNAICSDMDGTRDVIVNEVNQRQTAYDTVYMWNLKTKMYK